MRNSWIRFGALALIFLTVSQVSAFADAIEGRVARVNSTGLDVIVYDPQGRPYPNQLHLKTDSRTQTRGISSLSALRPDDAIGAEIRQEESRVWRADQVTLFQQINARPATQNPPPSLRDVLGNPVVRGALLGAATGAIASGTSGGKAGKGALVGAGVGAAAGLLGQWLGGGSSQTAADSGSDQ